MNTSYYYWMRHAAQGETMWEFLRFVCYGQANWNKYFDAYTIK